MDLQYDLYVWHVVVSYIGDSAEMTPLALPFANEFTDLHYKMIFVPWLLLSLSVTCFGDIITSDPNTRQLYDSDGRQRLFHGVNVVYKGANRLLFV